MKKTVSVIGGGLAGFSCAIELAEKGLDVTVFEANHYIGGRTSSWDENGMEIESGFHRFLGVYKALPDLLEKAGVNIDGILCWEDEIEIRIPDGGPHAVLGLAPLHKPFGTLSGILSNNDWLKPSDKLALNKFFAAAILAYKKDPYGLDGDSVKDFAIEHGISERAIHNLLRPLTEIFFLPPERFSMFNLVSLFVPYATRLHKLRVGGFLGGMTEVMMKPLAEHLIRLGGQVKTEASVDRLMTKDGRVTGVITREGEKEYDHTVLAVSLAPAQKLISAADIDQASFRPMLELKSLPLVTFQIDLDRPAVDVDRTTFGPGTVLISFSEQSRTTFSNSKGRLSIILPSDKRYLGMPAEDILQLVIKDAKRLGLDLAGHVLSYRKVSLPDDFYSLEPGVAKLRPTQETQVPGLTLAGDYTKQDYIGTMEGAVVSGQMAAGCVLAEMTQ